MQEARLQDRSPRVAVAHAILDCWDVVRHRPPEPVVVARRALAEGKYMQAEKALRAPMLVYTSEGPSAEVQTLYLYVLEYHVFHWRNKVKSTAKEEGLTREIRQAFDEAHHLNESAWQAVSVLAYIHLKQGNHKKCDFLLYEIGKFVDNRALPLIVQAMLYMQWVPPRPLRAEDFKFSFAFNSAKPKGSRNVDASVQLLRYAMKLEPKVVAAHKCLAIVLLQFYGDVEEAQDLFSHALSVFRKDPDSLWWSAEIANDLGYIQESRKYHDQAALADPTCDRDDFHMKGPSGGRAWIFDKFVSSND